MIPRVIILFGLKDTLSAIVYLGLKPLSEFIVFKCFFEKDFLTGSTNFFKFYPDNLQNFLELLFSELRTFFDFLCYFRVRSTLRLFSGSVMHFLFE